MKIILTLLLFISANLYADRITKRYPHRSSTKASACDNAKMHVKRLAGDECRYGFSEPLKVNCSYCDEKRGFGVSQWACTGIANYKCHSTSRSVRNNNKDKSLTDKAIHKLRGTLRQNTKGGQSPCLQYPNSQKCYEWKKHYQRAGGVR